MKIRKMLLNLLGCLFISSCNLVIHVPIKVSKLEGNLVENESFFEINSPIEIRGEISSIISQFSQPSSNYVVEPNLLVNYQIFKSGTKMNLDEYSWGLFYARNNSVMIFLRKDFLTALKQKIDKDYDSRAITITFEFLNDTEKVVYLRVMGAWIDNLPTGHNFESIILKPNSKVLIRISDVSIHYLLLNGVESIATIMFEEPKK